MATYKPIKQHEYVQYTRAPTRVICLTDLFVYYILQKVATEHARLFVASSIAKQAAADTRITSCTPAKALRRSNQRPAAAVTILENRIPNCCFAITAGGSLNSVSCFSDLLHTDQELV